MAKSDRTIVLFSRWFPYNKWNELSFLGEEIKNLEEQFSKVMLVPQKVIGEKHELSARIQVDESMSECFGNISFKEKLATVCSLLFVRELFKIRFGRTKRKYSLSTLLSAIVVRNWLRRTFKEEENLVFYSFWLDFSTLGAVLASRRNDNWKVVSRCHNFDLYGNKENQFYVPYQSFTLKHLNAVYPDSKAGEEYILNNFDVKDCRSQIMGVPAAPRINEGSKDGVLRIVSCSHMIQRKRVPLIMRCLSELAEINEDISYIWTHIGDGEELDQVKALIQKKPKNLQAKLLGRLTNEELEAFYINNPIDLFVNLSEKEGTPVSLMEAISFGIPVIVSGFGGNREVAENGGGVSLSLNPDEDEFVTEITKFLAERSVEEIRKNAYNTWRSNYNEARNYSIFCEHLKTVV